MSNVTLSQSKTSYEKLEEQYRGFIAPTFKIVVSNKDIAKEGMAVESVSVNMSINPSADTASFSVINAFDLIKRDFLWTDTLLKLGNTVEVYTGYTDQLEPIFFGYITNVDFNYSSDAPTIEITAMDISFFMMRSGTPQIWKNMKISDIVKEIGRKYGITSFDVDDDGQMQEEVVKNIETDHEFLREQAILRDNDFFVVGKKLYFRKKSASKTPLMKLEWGKNLMSFRVEHDIADQLSKVIVRAIIEDTKEVVVVESSNVTKIGSNSITGSDIMNKLGSFIEVIQRNVKDRSEAQRIADARIEKVAKKLVSASASCIGLPEIRAGRYIDIGGLGKKLDTTYSIVSATHTVDTSVGYQTTFTLQGNAV